MEGGPSSAASSEPVSSKFAELVRGLVNPVIPVVSSIRSPSLVRRNYSKSRFPADVPDSAHVDVERRP